MIITTSVSLISTFLTFILYDVSRNIYNNTNFINTYVKEADRLSFRRGWLLSMLIFIPVHYALWFTSGILGAATLAVFLGKLIRDSKLFVHYLPGQKKGEVLADLRLRREYHDHFDPIDLSPSAQSFYGYHYSTVF